jgi:hypothetical protein
MWRGRICWKEKSLSGRWGCTLENDSQEIFGNAVLHNHFFEECIPDASATLILFPEKKQAHSMWDPYGIQASFGWLQGKRRSAAKASMSDL